MLRLREVAERLNCSLSNVYALIEQGRLATVSVGAGGKGYRVAEAELQRFLAERRRHLGKETPTSPKNKTLRPFKHLDGDKLRAAWRQQGVE